MTTARAPDGATIAYRVLGTGTQGVVLVHGWSMAGAVWDELLKLLSVEGLKVVVPDLRGNGESDKPATGYSVGRFADDVLAVADAAGLKSFSVIGHSMGGQVAQWLAATSPQRVRSMLLMNTVPARGMLLPPDATALIGSAAGNAQAFGKILDMVCRALPPKQREKLVQLALAASPGAITEGFDAWSRAHFEDQLASIRCPTLVLATDDPLITPVLLREAVARRIRGARQAYLPGPGHYPQVERPKETTAIVEAFLAGAPST